MHVMPEKHHPKNATWYKKAIAKTAKDVFSSVLFYVLFVLLLALWYFLLGKGFVWRSIDPVSVPTIPSRLLYSALTYCTLGAFLYAVGFYKALADFFGRLLHSWKAYRAAKAIIWNSLILLMIFWIIPKVVDFLNLVATVLYNGVVFVLYLSTPLGVSIILFASYLILKAKKGSKVVSLKKSSSQAAK